MPANTPGVIPTATPDHAGWHQRASTSNRLKPLVVCADDYAVHAPASSGIAALAAAGRISATSVMVLSPRWAQDGARLQDVRGRIDVGLHLDWTSAFAVAAGHGGSLGGALLRAALGGFRQSAARLVIERQLDAFEAVWQAPPDHVDGHQHVQQFNGIRQPLVDLLARRYGAHKPWLRVSRPPAGSADLKSRVIAACGAAALQKIASCAHIAWAGALLGIYNFSGGQAAYARHAQAWLGDGATGALLMCHPALADAPGDAIGPARAWEYAYLASDAWTHDLATHGVALVRGSALYTCRP